MPAPEVLAVASPREEPATLDLAGQGAVASDATAPAVAVAAEPARSEPGDNATASVEQEVSITEAPRALSADADTREASNEPTPVSTSADGRGDDASEAASPTLAAHGGPHPVEPSTEAPREQREVSAPRALLTMPPVEATTAYGVALPADALAGEGEEPSETTTVYGVALPAGESAEGGAQLAIASPDATSRTHAEASAASEPEAPAAAQALEAAGVASAQAEAARSLQAGPEVDGPVALPVAVSPPSVDAHPVTKQGGALIDAGDAEVASPAAMSIALAPVGEVAEQAVIAGTDAEAASTVPPSAHDAGSVTSARADTAPEPASTRTALSVTSSESEVDAKAEAAAAPALVSASTEVEATPTLEAKAEAPTAPAPVLASTEAEVALSLEAKAEVAAAPALVGASEAPEAATAFDATPEFAELALVSASAEPEAATALDAKSEPASAPTESNAASVQGRTDALDVNPETVATSVMVGASSDHEAATTPVGGASASTGSTDGVEPDPAPKPAPVIASSVSTGVADAAPDTASTLAPAIESSVSTGVAAAEPETASSLAPSVSTGVAAAEPDTASSLAPVIASSVSTEGTDAEPVTGSTPAPVIASVVAEAEPESAIATMPVSAAAAPVAIDGADSESAAVPSPAHVVGINGAEPESAVAKPMAATSPEHATAIPEATVLPLPGVSLAAPEALPEPEQPAPRAPIELDDLPAASGESMELASTWEFVGWQGREGNESIGHVPETTWADRAVDLDGPALSVVPKAPEPPPATELPLASTWDFIQQPWQPATGVSSELVTSLLASASASTETPSGGPAVTAEQVLAALDGVGTQGTLGKVLLAYCAGRFRRAFLLGESFGIARVGHAWGPGSDSAAVSTLKVDLEAPSLLNAAMAVTGPSVVIAPNCAQDEAIFSALGGDAASRLLVIALRSRGRPVAFVVADPGAEPVDPSLLDDFTRVVDKVSEAYDRLPSFRGT